MDTGDLHNKVELWGKVEFTNELHEKDTRDGKIKDIFVNIIPANLTGSVQNSQASTKYAEVTHRIKCRKLSIKDLSIDMWFKDKDGLKYEILYYQPDYKNNEYWDILTKIIYE